MKPHPHKQRMKSKIVGKRTAGGTEKVPELLNKVEIGRAKRRSTMKKEKQESQQEVINDQQKSRQEETEQGFERLTDEEMKQVSGGMARKKR